MVKIIKILVLLLLPLGSLAQTPAIKVFDLFAIPSYNEIEIDSIVIIDSIVSIEVEFRIETISEADSIYLNIGKTEGGVETEKKAYDVVYTSGKYTLYDGQNSVIVHRGYVILRFSVHINDLPDFRYIEIFGKDNQGQITVKNKIQL